MDESQVNAIVIDTTHYKDYDKHKYVETKVLNADVGDTLDLEIP